VKSEGKNILKAQTKIKTKNKTKTGTGTRTKAGEKSRVWVVYILRCSDESLYTGMTNNIERRFAAHNQGTAAKYTRSRRPLELNGSK